MDSPAGDTTAGSTAQTPPSFSGIHRYDIEKEVGRGAMGIVYRATHKLLKKTVALKVVHPGESGLRFHREAQVLARIRSPFVVTVHDFEELPNGTFVLCMEWVDGGNLSDVMLSRGGRLRENQAVRWMDQVAQGMSAVAEEGSPTGISSHRTFSSEAMAARGSRILAWPVGPRFAATSPRPPR